MFYFQLIIILVLLGVIYIYYKKLKKTLKKYTSWFSNIFKNKPKEEAKKSNIINLIDYLKNKIPPKNKK